MELQPTDPYRADIPLVKRIECYKNLLKEFVFGVWFEDCWKKIFFPETPLERPLITEKDLFEVATHCFQPGMLQDKNGDEKLTTICVVPNTRYHWDVILFAFHLFFPQFYKCTADVALYIVKALELTKAKVNKIQNFDNYTYSFLQKHSQGSYLANGTENWMVVDPVYCSYMLARTLDLTVKKFNNVMDDKDLPEEVVKTLHEMKDRIKTSVEHFFQ